MSDFLKKGNNKRKSIFLMPTWRELKNNNQNSNKKFQAI